MGRDARRGHVCRRRPCNRHRPADADAAVRSSWQRRRQLIVHRFISSTGVRGLLCKCLFVICSFLYTFAVPLTFAFVFFWKYVQGISKFSPNSLNYNTVCACRPIRVTVSAPLVRFDGIVCLACTVMTIWLETCPCLFTYVVHCLFDFLTLVSVIYLFCYLFCYVLLFVFVFTDDK